MGRPVCQVGRAISARELALRDRRALAAAASKGLGRACAEGLVAEGARVFISSRDPERTGREIGAAGWLASDLSSEDGPERTAGEAARVLGGLDIMIVNAGGPPPGTFQGTDLPAWEAGFQLTLMCAIRLVKATLPLLR